MSNKKDERIDDYTDEDVVEEVVETTEIPKQRDFYKIPRRFGSVPVDELPLGCDPTFQYQKIYPRIPLPFQKADRVSFGHGSNLEGLDLAKFMLSFLICFKIVLCYY